MSVDFEPIVQALYNNSILTTLILALNTLSLNNINLLSEILAINKSITYLRLSKIDIESEGWVKLSSAIKVNTSIIDLNLFTSLDY